MIAPLPRPLHLDMACPHCTARVSFVFEARHRPISENKFCWTCRKVHLHLHYRGKCPVCGGLALYDMKL